jgi:hypothetical protein
MNTRTFFKAALVPVFGVALLGPGAGCEQQKPKCATGRGSFAARYTVVSGPASCQERKGEKLGVQTYNAIGKHNNPDLDRSSIAIQSESLGLLVDNAESAGVKDPDANHKPYAFGAFTTAEPEGDFCTVPSLTPAVQSLEAVKEDPDKKVTEQPKSDVTYAWSNVRVYVTPAAYGTQFTANLTLTTNGEACVYNVQAMYPYVDCSKPDPNDPKKLLPDDSACAAEANPAAGRPTGSGINPDFPVRCDPDLLACVLTRDGLPVLR